MDENEHLPTPALSGSGSRVEAGFGPLSATSSPDVRSMVTFKAAFVKGPDALRASAPDRAEMLRQEAIEGRNVDLPGLQEASVVEIGRAHV